MPTNYVFFLVLKKICFRRIHFEEFEFLRYICLTQKMNRFTLRSTIF